MTRAAEAADNSEALGKAKGLETAYLVDVDLTTYPRTARELGDAAMIALSDLVGPPRLVEKDDGSGTAAVRLSSDAQGTWEILMSARDAARFVQGYERRG